MGEVAEDTRIAAENELAERVRALTAAGDDRGAATLVLRHLGPGVFGLLLAIHANEDDAADVFSAFSERVWRGLPGFRWESSLRGWAYVIARNESRRWLEHQRDRARRRAPISGLASEIPPEVRTATLSLYRTENRDALAALRASLPIDEQMLLVLRVDRELSWPELARVFNDGEELSEEATKREAARLRKRFQLLKEKLLALGAERGLRRQ
ncbi:MAG: sigma-70 family RNA polymerase sigma factor [Polyangiaceae bacterium]